MVAGFQRISSCFVGTKLLRYRPLKKLEKALAREIAFARLWEKIGKLVQCPFLVSFATPSDVGHCCLHSLRFRQMTQLHARQVFHEGVVARIWLRLSARNELDIRERVESVAVLKITYRGDFSWNSAARDLPFHSRQNLPEFWNPKT